MATREEALQELYRRGALKGKQRAAYEELVRRGGAGDDGTRQLVTARTREAERAPLRKKSFGLIDAVTSGLGVRDEMAGGAAAIGQGASNFVRRLQGQPIEVPAATAYQAAAEASKEDAAGYKAEHPFMNALAVGSGFVLGGPAGGARQTALRAGAGAAAANAPFAVGRQEGDLKDRLPGAAVETAMAFGLGSAGQAASNVLGARAAARAAAPPSAARTLANEGVQLTPGQMMGGFAQRLEDGMRSVPLVGDAIVGAQRRTNDSLRRVALNRGLAEIGEELPAATGTGRDGVAEAGRRISDFYNRTLDAVQVAPDAPFVQRVAQIEATLQGDELNAFRQIVARDVNARMGMKPPAPGQAPAPAGPISGRAWKEIDETLGLSARQAETASATQGPTQRHLREALEELQDAHFDLLSRNNPQAAQAIEQADAAFANQVRIENAAGKVGSRGGEFGPSQLNNAVRSTDTSARKRSYARGNALLQDLSDPAMEVLPQTVPDSGTAFRSMLGGGLVAGAAVPATSGLAVPAIAAVAGAHVAYSRPVIAALNALYRASTPGSQQRALSELARLATQEPGAQAAYSEALQQLGVAQPPRQQGMQ